MSKHVLLPMAQGMEELEFITVSDLLVRAGFTVYRATIDELEVEASRGARLLADHKLSDVQHLEFDAVVLVGGQPGTDNLQSSERLASLLLGHYQRGQLTAAICAAPKILLGLGMLENRRFTCFPGVMAEMDTGSSRQTGAAVMLDDHVLTSRGPGTAMEFALNIIELLTDSEQRARVEASLVA